MDIAPMRPWLVVDFPTTWVSPPPPDSTWPSDVVLQPGEGPRYRIVQAATPEQAIERARVTGTYAPAFAMPGTP